MRKGVRVVRHCWSLTVQASTKIQHTPVMLLCQHFGTDPSSSLKLYWLTSCWQAQASLRDVSTVTVSAVFELRLHANSWDGPDKLCIGIKYYAFFLACISLLAWTYLTHKQCEKTTDKNLSNCVFHKRILHINPKTRTAPVKLLAQGARMMWWECKYKAQSPVLGDYKCYRITD